jgi:hypothetical protein
MFLNFVPSGRADAAATPLEIVKLIVDASPKAERKLSENYFSQGLKHAFDALNAIEACDDQFDGDLITGDQGLVSRQLLKADFVFDTGLVAEVSAKVKTKGDGVTAEQEIVFVFIFEEGQWKIEEIIRAPSLNKKFAYYFENTMHTRIKKLVMTKCD